MRASPPASTRSGWHAKFSTPRTNSSMSDDTYEAFAIRYARVDRNAAENFIGGDPHDAPMPLNYYVWVVRNRLRTIVIDTGFDERGARERKRTIVNPVAEGLEALGVD